MRVSCVRCTLFGLWMCEWAHICVDMCGYVHMCVYMCAVVHICIVYVGAYMCIGVHVCAHVHIIPSLGGQFWNLPRRGAAADEPADGGFVCAVYTFRLEDVCV